MLKQASTCFLVIPLLIVSAACSRSKSPKAAAKASITPMPTYVSTGLGTTGNLGVTITSAGAVSNNFLVSLNQPVVWSFEAKSNSTGSVGQITTITASTTVSNMQITAPTVNFTPTTQAELTGSLTVNATVGSETGTQVFTWQASTTGSDSSTGGFNIMGAMMGMLPSLLSGNMNIGSLVSGALMGGLGGMGGMGGFGGTGMSSSQYGSQYGSQQYGSPYGSQSNGQYGNQTPYGNKPYGYQQ